MHFWENAFAVTTLSLVLEATLNDFYIGNVKIMAGQLLGTYATMQMVMSPRLHRTVADQDELEAGPVSRELPKPLL